MLEEIVVAHGLVPAEFVAVDGWESQSAEMFAAIVISLYICFDEWSFARPCVEYSQMSQTYFVAQSANF